MSRASTLEAGAPRETSARAPVDMNDLEMVFGTPTSPKRIPNTDVHTITNEHSTGNQPTQKHNSSNKADDVEALHSSTTHTTQPKLPLLEINNERPKPPIAGPEIDDLDEKPVDRSVEGFHGIDDGLLEPIDKTPDVFGNGDKEGKPTEQPHETETHDDGVGTDGDDGKWLWPHDETDYPYDINGMGNRFGADDRPVSPLPASIPDVNTYQQKKNLAQGMMDLALLSANANQLRYVVESSSSGHPYFYSSITLITMSIILQVGVGIGLIINSRYNVNDEKARCKADKINNMTVLGVFLITIVNVFITSFSVAPSSTGMAISVAAVPVVQQAAG